MSFPATLPLWVTIGVISVGTFLLRLSFVQWWANREVPPVVSRLLRLVPGAVLCALVLPAVALRELPPDAATSHAGLLANPRLVAAGIAAIVAIGTHNVLITIAAGMLALWGIQLLP